MSGQSAVGAQVHVRMRVGGEHYALAVEHVEEVLELSEVTPVPGAPSAMLGLQSLNGEILPAYNLAAILEIPADGRPQRLVIAEHEGQRAALAVDEVIDVGKLDGTPQESDSHPLLESTVLDGTLVGVLAVDALFERLTGQGQA